MKDKYGSTAAMIVEYKLQEAQEENDDYLIETYTEIQKILKLYVSSVLIDVVKTENNQLKTKLNKQQSENEQLKSQVNGLQSQVNVLESQNKDLLQRLTAAIEKKLQWMNDI